MYVLISLFGLEQLPLLRLDPEGDLLLARRLGDVLQAGDRDDLGPLGDLDRLGGHRLGVVLDEHLDVDRLVGEATGDEHAPHLELVLDEDGRSGDEVADGDVLGAGAGVLGAEADGDDRHLLAVAGGPRPGAGCRCCSLRRTGRSAPRSACPPGAGRRRPGPPPRSVSRPSGSNAWSGRCSCSVLSKR